MQIGTGTILESLASDLEDYFDEAFVIVVQNDDDGAIGLVFNRQYGRSLTDLQEFKSAPKINLFEGGPMQQDHLYFIHRIAEVGGTHVKEDMYFGGDFSLALSLIEQGKVSLSDIKIFIGYCGWDKDQLEAELEEGAWRIVDNTTDAIVLQDF